MRDASSGPSNPEGERGALGSLSDTRPQRPGARRARAKRSPRQPRPATASPLRAPKQGFEAESELEPGKTVAPPSGAELATSLVEAIGELAQSGLSSGGRMLKEAFSRLPGA